MKNMMFGGMKDGMCSFYTFSDALCPFFFFQFHQALFCVVFILFLVYVAVPF